MISDPTGHICQPVPGDGGQPAGWVLGEPAMSEETKQALAELVAAARREYAVGEDR